MPIPFNRSPDSLHEPGAEFASEMKIAFGTLYDARDVRRGSGSYYHMARELERQGHLVHYLGPVDVELPPATRVLGRLSRRLGMRYSSYQDPFTGSRVGEWMTRELNGLDYDILLTNDYAIAAYVRSSKPIVLYTDAMFPFNYAENIHPWIANLSPISAWLCQRVIKAGLHRASLRFFAAEHAVREARRYLDGTSHHVECIPFGANLEQPPSCEASRRDFECLRAKGVVQLLFVGKDWALKGGKVAVETVSLLRKRGIPAVLHVVGADLPVELSNSFVKGYGLLDKSRAGDSQRLSELYSIGDVLLLPTIAEGFGIVFAEAAAYGLPSIARRTTGVMTAVRDGETGVLLDLDARADAFADVIQTWFENPATYDRLSRGAREYFETAVNWPTAVRSLVLSVASALPRCVDPEHPR